jgi:hypothetical protein
MIGLVILSCGTPVLVTHPPSVPVEPGSVETVVVQTAAAAQTQTLTVLPPTSTPMMTPLATRTATVTPTPTATFLFLFPTKTDIPDAFFEDDNGDGSGNGDGEDDEDERIMRRQLWACRVLSKSPADETVIIGGTSFRAIWTVENTGLETWPKKSVDIVFAGGTRLNEGKPYYDIPAAVAPGGKITISVTMNAPKRSKQYATRWALKIGRTQFCNVRFIISVK